MTHHTWKPKGLATAIGSMPHTDPEEACAVVLSHLKDIPAWPQLPNRSFNENMYAQYSEGLPGVVATDDRIYLDRSDDLSAPLQRLYSAYLENDVHQYAIGPDHAAGLHLFLKKRLADIQTVKGQITGPISFGLLVTDQDRRPILYDDTLADALARHLRLKAAWQERALARLAPRTIIFIDEPYLTSLGSAFVPLANDTVIRLINETLGGLNGLKGIHCCGNTDWPVLMNTDIDILNFDAFNYGESLALYPAEVKAFLDRGGIIAWGIVPSEEKHLQGISLSQLAERLENLLQLLSRKGISYDKLLEQSLITPSCGLASISPGAATSALKLTAELSREFRRSHNLTGKET